MIAIVRRFRPLTVLVLLLVGPLHTVASAQGATCARAAEQSGVAMEPAAGADVQGAAGPLAHHPAVTDAHDHSTGPFAEGPAAASGGCGMVAVLKSCSAPLLAAGTSKVRPDGDLSPGSLLTQSLFRPPRLS